MILTLENPLHRRRFLRAALPLAAASLVGCQHGERSSATSTATPTAAPTAAATVAPTAAPTAAQSAMSAYFEQVAAHVAKFRRYPALYELPAPQGRVVMRVVVARNGNLLDVAVAESSGHAKIDAAELEAVRQAAPFPPLPPEVPAGTATLLMPVNYLTVSRK